MKKTMIALAALGAMAGAAHAQSNVTMYGVVDMFVGESTTKTNFGGVPFNAVLPNNTTVGATVNTMVKNGMSLNSGGLSGSRWGLRGSEDLGGGLKANFQLESSISADTGASTGFTRTSKMGLSGGFGSIEMGRQYTQLFLLMDSFDAQGTSSFSATNAIFGTSLQAAFGNIGVAIPGANAASMPQAPAVRWDNSLLYTSPNMGGFTGAVQYAFGENGTPGASAGRSIGLSAAYTIGSFAVQGVYETVKRPGAGAGSAKSTGLGASYDFGMAKVLGQFITQKDGYVNGLKENGYVLSVAVPLGSAGSLNAGMGGENIKNATSGVKLAKTSSYGLEYRYDLSKRTTLYAGMTQVKTKLAAPLPAGDTTDKLYGFGMRHKF
ncbi:MAG: porin [Hydrogenophaga sp.]|uniref:porin n=1 Tax=Hydrogenophaga sp. TaxID=1904254 RepID=UPI003D105940